LSFTLAFISLAGLADTGRCDSQGFVELFIQVQVDGTDNVTREFHAQNVGGTVYDENFMPTNNYQEGSAFITGNAQGGFSFVDAGPVGGPILAYGLYKISGPSDVAWFRIDYRNCGYCCPPFPNGETSVDITIV